VNYNAAMLDELAAQFALGTLRHAARARFARLCRELPDAQAARQRWEDLLLPLALAIPPIAPSASCWNEIAQRIKPADGAHAARRVRPLWWQSALVASLLVGALITARFTVWNEPTWQPMATLAQANQRPLWQVERSADASQIHIRTLGAVTLPESQSYELWILPPGDAHPVSLGLLPRSGVLGRALTPTQRSLMLTANKVAVSIEPAGGSPTGLPTGPVVIVAVISSTS
jgi:anti-sigma-K factor RskA